MGAHLVVLAAVIATLACGAAGGESRRGRLEARWTGADTGRLAAAASAEWCGAGKFLEIRTARADSGVGLAIFPRDTIVPGRYPVFLAARADSNRPAAAVALRWFEPRTVRGFRADSGTVVLERGRGGALSGRITAAGPLTAGDTSRLALNGSFRDLRVRPATRGCAPIQAAPDTGVH